LGKLEKALSSVIAILSVVLFASLSFVPYVASPEARALLLGGFLLLIIMAICWISFKIVKSLFSEEEKNEPTETGEGTGSESFGR